MAPPRKPTTAPAAPAADEAADPIEQDVQRTISEADQRLDAAAAGEPDPHPLPSAAELKQREREADLRERELALREREQAIANRESAVNATAAPTGPPAAPEYLLSLSNGEQVEAPSAVATHHYGKDGRLHRVLAADPIPEEYGVPQVERDRRDREALRREMADR